MKIIFQASGGFAYLPAFSKPVEIDTDQLDERAAGQLESLVAESRFFEQPEEALPSKGAADYQTYILTIAHGAQSHTIKRVDPITDPGLQQLFTYIRNTAHLLKS